MTAAGDELHNAIGKLLADVAAQRLDALLDKSRSSDLSDEEKRELTALMTARPRSG